MQDGWGNIDELSEDCITQILSFTSPRDACASSLVSTTVRSAADSDYVWEKFLPMYYKDIVPSTVLSNISSKKELYFHLCHPILFYDDIKTLNLEKNNNKVCLMLGAKSLSINWFSYIVWTDTPGQGHVLYDNNHIITYWEWTAPSHSRFPEAIAITYPSWSSISCKVKTAMLSPKTTYEAYLIFKYMENLHEDGSEFVYVADTSINFLQGGGSSSGDQEICIELNPRQFMQYEEEGVFLSESEGGWLEVKLGWFNSGEDRYGEVEIILRGEDDGSLNYSIWKTCIIIQGIEIRPECPP